MKYGIVNISMIIKMNADYDVNLVQIEWSGALKCYIQLKIQSFPFLIRKFALLIIELHKN
jgi:hypothetical protein